MIMHCDGRRILKKVARYIMPTVTKRVGENVGDYPHWMLLGVGPFAAGPPAPTGKTGHRNSWVGAAASLRKEVTEAKASGYTAALPLLGVPV